MNMILRAIAVTALSMLAACTTVTTDNPIGVSAGAGNDMRLLGGWKAVQFGKDVATPSKNNEAAYAFFMPKKDGELQAIVAMTSTDPDDNDWMTFDILTGQAGDHAVMSVRRALDNGEAVKDQPPGYQPVLYRLGADGNLSLFMISDDAVRNAIQTGRIAGEMENNNIRITSDSQTLDSFVSEAGPMLFEPEPLVVFERLK